MKQPVVLLLLVLAVSGPAFADVSFWHGLTPVSRNYCQAFVESECCGDETCIGHELGWNDPDRCIVNTYDCSIYPETCSGRTEILYYGESTGIAGSTGHNVPTGYGWPESYADVGFRLWDPETLYIYYEISFDTGGLQPVAPIPSIQVVVFRFDGNPAELAGLGSLNYIKLIGSGLISSQDVLYYDNLIPDDTWHADGSAFVDISGIPLDEIVVLGNGYGILPECGGPPGGDGGAAVPAVSGWGAPALLLLILAASAVVLRRSRTSRE